MVRTTFIHTYIHTKINLPHQVKVAVGTAILHLPILTTRVLSLKPLSLSKCSGMDEVSF